ncbi:MAG: hypothetical protein UY58_C0005G0002 [Candidatus Magasanikbacteria bacterium GW2011_GWA2_50_22]|uniref:Uncharacterized protein n=1 Tax=Candidatus Magasanikbacteria bacterium GW2011_GWA2_50_22 TaxID=1619043 RepID=A0A0G1ZDQ6_9BACT|nr:MAG: hypothetical protein UY58_C0005G0002 [Candidatus Magasanikbacteria bacterium GW2011_GWA2_50_22]
MKKKLIFLSTTTVVLLVLLYREVNLNLQLDAKASNCRSNQAAVEATVSIIYVQRAANGDPTFPPALADSMFKGGSIPVCPDGGDISYNNTTGAAACPNAVATHAARF